MALSWRPWRKPEPKRTADLTTKNFEELQKAYDRLQSSSYYVHNYTDSWRRAQARRAVADKAKTGVMMHTFGELTQHCQKWLAIDDETWVAVNRGGFGKAVDPASIVLTGVHAEEECGMRRAPYVFPSGTMYYPSKTRK